MEYLNKYAESGEEFNGQDVMRLLAMDVITECGFGVRANAITDKDSYFNKKVKTC